jgi:hypothetical protein
MMSWSIMKRDLNAGLLIMTKQEISRTEKNRRAALLEGGGGILPN